MPLLHDLPSGGGGTKTIGLEMSDILLIVLLCFVL